MSEIIGGLALTNSIGNFSGKPGPAAAMIYDAAVKNGTRIVARSTSPITHIIFPCVGITGASPVHRVSIQGVTSEGLPDGTIKGGGSPASATFTPTVGRNRIALANAWSPATIGEAFSVVVEYSSGTVDFSNAATLIWAVGDGSGGSSASHLAGGLSSNSGSGWGNTGGNFPGILVEAGGVVYGGCCAAFADYFSTYAPTKKTVSSAGHRAACKWTVPSYGDFATSIAIRSTQFPNGSDNGTVKFGLWNAAGEVIATKTLHTYYGGAAGNNQIGVEWDTPPTVAPGDVVYAGVEAVGSDTAALWVLDFYNTTDRDAEGNVEQLRLGRSVYSQWNGSAWTDDGLAIPLTQHQLATITPAAGGGGAGGGVGSRFGLGL